MRRVILLLIVACAVPILILLLGPGDGGRVQPLSDRGNLPDLEPEPGAGNETGAPSAVADGPCTLTGSVRFADGTPLAGQVRIGERRIALDSEGRFAFTGLDAGLVKVRLTSDELEYPPRPIWVPTEGEFNLVIDEDWHTFSGRVVCAATDEPVADAKITVTGHIFGHFDTTIRGRSDHQGMVRLRLPERHSELRIQAEGFSPREVAGHCREGDSEIRLWRSASVSGVVSNADGTPLAGIPVHAFEFDDRFTSATTTISDREGRYALRGIPAGDLYVFAFGAGHCSLVVHSTDYGIGDRLVVSVQPGRETTADFTVVAAASVSGRVLDASGNGVPRTRVSVSQNPYVYGGPYALDPKQEIATDEEGRFRIDTLWPGLPTSFRAVLNRHSFAVECPALPPGATWEVELRAPSGRFAEMRVVAADTGEPINGARMWVGAAPPHTHSLVGR